MKVGWLLIEIPLQIGKQTNGQMDNGKSIVDFATENFTISIEQIYLATWIWT